MVKTVKTVKKRTSGKTKSEDVFRRNTKDTRKYQERILNIHKLIIYHYVNKQLVYRSIVTLK